MDGFKEKKWFVYLGDHHEGPFSLEEIQSKLNLGLVTPSSFVWAEGMTDWKLMTDIEAFQSLLKPKMEPVISLAPAPPLEPTIGPPTFESTPAIELSPIMEPVEQPLAPMSLAPEPTSSPLEIPQELQETQPEPQEDEPTSTVARPGKRSSLRTILRTFGVLIILGGSGYLYYTGQFEALRKSPALEASFNTVTDLLQPYLLKLSDRYPALLKWVSPISRLPDIAPEDYEELKAAARAKLEVDGPRVGIALSRADLTNPTFHVASNLPENTLVELKLDGIPDTLLNQLSFSTKTSATINKRQGKTGPIGFPDGKPIPRGSYQIAVSQNTKVLLTKTLFLGGAKDASYTERLNEFHEKMRAKATTELSEIKQFSLTLEGQLSLTLDKFAALKKGKVTPAQRKAWNQFHPVWIGIMHQMGETFSKWTPETIEKDTFYGSLYQLTQQVAQAVEKVHRFHHSYFTEPVDPKGFEIQLGEAAASASTALATLKAKIEQAEKLPTTPNGLPQREGL
ncbi:GYF domain-containing protein [Bdellovibrionota bacterium FG-2]